MSNKEKIRLLRLDIQEFNREKIRDLKDDIEDFDIEIFKAKKEIERLKKVLSLVLLGHIMIMSKKQKYYFECENCAIPFPRKSTGFLCPLCWELKHSWGKDSWNLE